MKKTILVTGGAGYIGSITILELLRNTEFEVLSVDNFLNSSSKTFERIKKITDKVVVNYNIDLRDLRLLRTIFEKHSIDGIIHFAALKSVPESLERPHWYYDNNLNSQLNIMKCCEDYGIKNLIFSSSCSVYGEVQNLPVDENTPLSEPKCPYAHTKRVGEEMLAFWSPQVKVNTIALRYFNPVGADPTGLLGEDPRNTPTNLVPVITGSAIGNLPPVKVFGSDYPTRDGSCIRDYVHVNDIADAHIKALLYLFERKNSSFFDIINLGTGNGVTVLEMIYAFEQVTQQKLQYELSDRRAGDVAQIYSNPQKAQKLLNWFPKYDVYQMMESAWKWQLYLKHEN